MSYKTFIAGDWGTSNLRLYLYAVKQDGSIEIIESQLGPGVSEIKGDFEDRFFSLTHDWINQYGKMPVILSGMVGSNIGWKTAPYSYCPAGAEEIAQGRLAFSARGLDFSILSGLRTTNPLQEPDVMRGEELQLLGWLRNNQKQITAPQLFALPGTHNKWALVRDQKIQTFLTAFTGELFALLRKKSTLISDTNTFNVNQDAFMEGVKSIEKLGSAHLVHILFSTRSRQVIGEMASADGLSYLSGLIIAADIRGALDLFENAASVTIIGEVILSQKYKIVLDYLKIENDCCNSADIAAAGFAAVYRALYT